METVPLGPLTVRRITVPPSVAKSAAANAGKDAGSSEPVACVLCHGFGAPGDDLVGLADALAPSVPAGSVFVFPEAPLSLTFPGAPPDFGGARAWWMIDMMELERARMRGEIRDLSKQVPEGLDEARAALSGMLDALKAESPSRRLVLGGFSQGAMVSLDLVLREPERAVAGVALLSGTFLSESEWVPRMAARKGTPVFQSHGNQDPMLPFELATRLRDRMTEAGLGVEFDPFQGPHTIPLGTLRKLAAWLGKVSR